MDSTVDIVDMSITCLWRIKTNLCPGKGNQSRIDLNKPNLSDTELFTDTSDSTLVLDCTFSRFKECYQSFSIMLDFTILDNTEKCFMKGKPPMIIERSLITDNIQSLQRPDGYFLVKCEIHMIESKFLQFEKADESETDEYADGMKDFENLLQSNKFCDVKIISADGKELYAHKVILAARSPVFSSYFENDMKEKQENVIEITDIDSYVIEAGLRYIYSNKFDGLSDIAGELMYFADKYDVKGLRIECETAVAKDVNIENAIQVLIIADKHSCAELKIKALDFVKKNMREISKSEDFKSLKSLYPHLLEDIICELVK